MVYHVHKAGLLAAVCKAEMQGNGAPLSGVGSLVLPQKSGGSREGGGVGFLQG